MKETKKYREAEPVMGAIAEADNARGQTVQKKRPGKKAGDAQIVVAMVMIVIALVLCFLFKNQITSFMTTAISTMSTKMSTLLNGLE